MNRKFEKMADRSKKTYSVLTIVLIVSIIVLLSVIGFLLGRIGTAGPPGPPQPGLPVTGPPPPPAELNTATGTVTGYVHNVHLDINGIQIRKPGEGLLTFEFRPHTASAVLKIAKPGQQVEIRYDTRPNDEAIVYQLREIKNNRSGQSLDVGQLPPPPRIPPGQQAQLFQVRLPRVITDNYGGIAALQAPGKLFHFKPAMVQDIQALIKNGRDFGLLAVERGDGQGFVNIHHDQVYIVISITIDNKTFMIR